MEILIENIPIFYLFKKNLEQVTRHILYTYKLQVYDRDMHMIYRFTIFEVFSFTCMFAIPHWWTIAKYIN